MAATATIWVLYARSAAGSEACSAPLPCDHWQWSLYCVYSALWSLTMTVVLGLQCLVITDGNSCAGFTVPCDHWQWSLCCVYSAAGDSSDPATSVTPVKTDSPSTGRQRASSVAKRTSTVRQSKVLTSPPQLIGSPGSPSSSGLPQTPPLPSSTHIVCTLLLIDINHCIVCDERSV